MKLKSLICVAIVAACPTLFAAGTTTFDNVMEHYEPIRLALLEDSMDGVNDHGKAIAAELRALESDFSAERAGASDGAASIVEEDL
ncbi:MAG: hypothetical protein MUP13_12400, partial [Thermoanaerobaculales bacterium]|nr:hypothetical protein [Thermoanaerobaculales bacterium]